MEGPDLAGGWIFKLEGQARAGAEGVEGRRVGLEGREGWGGAEMGRGQPGRRGVLQGAASGLLPKIEP